MDGATAAWQQVAIAWLTGPRRVGKTVLAQQVPEARFLNCDLPSVAERLADPEDFFRSLKEKVVVFDEVHQLADPSRLLKIGADDAVECKWQARAFEPRGLLAFRAQYPRGRNFVVSPTDGDPYQRSVGGLDVTFLGPADLRRLRAKAKHGRAD